MVRCASSRNHAQYAKMELSDRATSRSLHQTEEMLEVTPCRNLSMRNNEVAKVNQGYEQVVNKNRMWLMCYCFIGIMVSFTLHGIMLERIATHRVLGEMSMTSVFCAFNSIVAIGLSRVRNEKPSTMPQSLLALVGALAFASTIASMVALRYVTYITRILGKSCRSIPIMVLGVLLGRKYDLKKYLSVIVLSTGVAIFLFGTVQEKQEDSVEQNSYDDTSAEHKRTPNMVIGFSLLVLSLFLDGATGALEDKFMETYHIGAFDLMFSVNLYKALFSAFGMVINGEATHFLKYVIPSLPSLFMLSFTGAWGQAFIFFTISNFGALTSAIIGTCRKVLSIVLSVVLFGHILSIQQMVGLGFSFLGIGLNWVNLKRFPTVIAELEGLSKVT
ncbi:putative UAA transporter [Plasmopara halstedii]